MGRGNGRAAVGGEGREPGGAEVGDGEGKTGAGGQVDVGQVRLEAGCHVPAEAAGCGEGRGVGEAAEAEPVTRSDARSVGPGAHGGGCRDGVGGGQERGSGGGAGAAGAGGGYGRRQGGRRQSEAPGLGRFSTELGIPGRSRERMGSLAREPSTSETLKTGAASALASAHTSLDLSRDSMDTPQVRDNILDEDDVAEALAEDFTKDKNTAIMIWLGILIDAVPESMVIGFIVAEGSRNPLVFVVGVFLSNFPEALASAATMKKVGLSIPTIMTLWTSTCVITGLGALFGALIIPESGMTGGFELFVKGMEGLAAGAMLTMIAQVSSLPFPPTLPHLPSPRPPSRAPFPRLLGTRLFLPVSSRRLRVKGIGSRV